MQAKKFRSAHDIIYTVQYYMIKSQELNANFLVIILWSCITLTWTWWASRTTFLYITQTVTASEHQILIINDHKHNTRNMHWELSTIALFWFCSTGLGMGVWWCSWNQNRTKYWIRNVTWWWTSWRCVLSDGGRKWRVKGDGKWWLSSFHNTCVYK